MYLGNEIRMNVLSMLQGALLVPSEKGTNNLRQSLIVLEVSESGLLVESGDGPSPQWRIPFTEISCRVLVEVAEGIPSTIYIRFTPQEQLRILHGFILNRFNWLFPRSGNAVGVVYPNEDMPGLAMLDFMAGGWLASNELLKVNCWIESVGDEELFLAIGGKNGDSRSVKFRDFKIVIGINVSGEPPITVCSIEPQNTSRAVLVQRWYDWLVYEGTAWPVETPLLGYEEGEVLGR